MTPPIAPVLAPRHEVMWTVAPTGGGGPYKSPRAAQRSLGLLQMPGSVSPHIQTRFRQNEPGNGHWLSLLQLVNGAQKLANAGIAGASKPVHRSAQTRTARRLFDDICGIDDISRRINRVVLHVHAQFLSGCQFSVCKGGLVGAGDTGFTNTPLMFYLLNKTLAVAGDLFGPREGQQVALYPHKKDHGKVSREITERLWSGLACGLDLQVLSVFERAPGDARNSEHYHNNCPHTRRGHGMIIAWSP